MSHISSWSIGNGAAIQAWTDCWIEPGIVIEDLDVVIPDACLKARLCDLVTNNGSWNWQQLAQWLPVGILHKIMAILPPCMEYREDEMLIAGFSEHHFSVSTCYQNLTKHTGNNTSIRWVKIWALKVQERVRSFIWMLAHDRIASNFLLSSKRLRNASCQLCGCVMETALHALRDCRVAMQIWMHKVPISIVDIFYGADLQEWINCNLNANTKWASYWAIGCHSLWHWRNKECHKDEYNRPLVPDSYIHQRVYDYMNASKIDKVMVPRERSIINVGWKPPDPGWVKLNTDSARVHNTIAGCGGIVRNINGDCLRGFSKYLGLCSVFKAELWGVFEGLKIIHELGLRKVDVNVDSRLVADMINTGRATTMDSVSMVRHITNLMQSIGEVKVSHCYREANFCADALAKFGATSGGGILFKEDYPLFISHLLSRDALGVLSPRLSSL